MTEVLARRENRLFLLPSFALLCAAAVFVVCFFADDWFSALFVAIFGLLFLGYAVFGLISLLRAPALPVVLQDGKLFIHGERTEPEKIGRLEYRVQSLLGSGTVTIVAAGKTYECRHVRRAAGTVDRLYALLPKERRQKAADRAESGTTESVLAARREIGNASFVLSLGVTVLFLLCDIGMFFPAEPDRTGILLFSLLTGFSLLVLLGYFLPRKILYDRTPRQIIVRRGDELKFAGATCKIEEIQAVDYVESVTRTFSLGYGLLVLTVGGRKYRLFFVDDVARVANLLSRLRFLAKECD